MAMSIRALAFAFASSIALLQASAQEIDPRPVYRVETIADLYLRVNGAPPGGAVIVLAPGIYALGASGSPSTRGRLDLPPYTDLIGDGPGVPYADLLTGPPDRPDRQRHDARPDDLLSLNYTSGSTGRPKGVRRTHRVRFASLVNMVADVLGGPPAPTDVYLHAGPITHTSGLFTLPSAVCHRRRVFRLRTATRLLRLSTGRASWRVTASTSSP